MTRPRRAVPAAVDRDLRRLVNVVASSSSDLRDVRRAATSSGEPAVIDAVAQWLYQHWYLEPDPAPSQDETRMPHANLAAALRAALPASTRWLRGWTVIETRANGGCVAGRRGVARELRCGDYANVSRPGVPVAPGDGVAVVECVDWIDWQAGFWTTRSAAGEPFAPLVRLYSSVTEERIFAVLRRVAGCLDDLQVRYSLKCPVRSADFARVDSLVVYLERAAWDTVRDTVTGVARQSRGDLRSSSPPLTRRIAPGVAFAQDPGPAESFGQSRCRALSPGVIGMLDEDRRIDDHVLALAEALQRAGIDPGRPWVCPHN